MFFIRKLFDFNKPTFLNLDYIDIVLEEKTLFLVSWRSKKHHKVKISPLNKTYRNYETAVVLKIPASTKDLTITLHSFWRKCRYRVLLEKVKLDNETAQYLITNFKRVEVVRLKTFVVNAVRTFRDTNLPVIVLKRPDLKITTPYLSINTGKLTYSNKTNYHE
jgi:hypothetical protein